MPGQDGIRPSWPSLSPLPRYARGRWPDHSGPPPGLPHPPSAEGPFCPAKDRPQRDLFPLPLIPESPSGSGASRSSRQRGLQRRLLRRDANEGVRALNALYGCSYVSEAVPTEPQTAVHHSLLRRFRDSRPEHGVPSTEEALQELLGSSTDYAGAVCHVKPFERGKVSLPSSQRRPVVLTDVCDPVCRRLLETFEDQLLVDEHIATSRRSEEEIRPYLDERLKSSREDYLFFLGTLVEAKILGSCRRRRGFVTPFSVAKKSGKLRLVLDCRMTNQKFRHAPPMELAAPEVLSRLKVPEGKSVFAAQADISDCFYQLLIPSGLSEYFCMPALTPAEALQIGLTHAVSGAPIDPEGLDRVHPCLLVLPMGWGWAFWFIQRLEKTSWSSPVSVPSRSSPIVGLSPP